MNSSKYDGQVRLLLDVLPLLAEFPQFALKGGTAINLFYRKMPRRSVDIDLVYLPLENRDDSLTGISEALKALNDKINSDLSGTQSSPRENNRIVKGKNLTIKLDIQRGPDLIKIEPNLVIRGSVQPAIEKDLCDEAEKVFEKSVSVRCVSFEDAFGGKMCAALDRQHPRDFFDIKLLLENEGLSEPLIHSFIFYLCSHNRPFSELLDPHFNREFHSIYEREFAGMPTIDVTADELVTVFETFKRDLFKNLDESSRKFIVSFSEGNPEWSLISKLSHVQKYPSIQWKLMNIQKMDSDKKRQEVECVRKVLGA